MLILVFSCTIKCTKLIKNTMIDHLSITSARHELTSLPEKLTREDSTLAITRRGKPVLAVMTWQHYEAIIETLEILSDRTLMNNIRKGIVEANSGEGFDWESVKQDLD